jgi:general secretion pathway protein L
MDVPQLRQDVGAAWHLMQDWRFLRWLSPELPTQVALPDGKTIGILEQLGATGSEVRIQTTARFFGLLVPQEMVLWHQMHLPELPPNEEFMAVELEARSLSPFPAEDLVWAYVPARDAALGRTAQIAIASKKIVSKLLNSKAQAEGAATSLEVWVKSPASDAYLLLPGFGESRRRKFTARWRQVNWGLVIVLVLTLSAIAVTPTAQLRLRALQGLEDFSRIQAVANPAMHKREQQMQLDQQGKALSSLMAKALEPEVVLLQLTQLLPDDTFVTTLRAQGGKIVIAGQTPNTAVLMQQLGSQPGVKDVKSPVPATKQRGADRENFTVEFSLDKPTLNAVP